MTSGLSDRYEAGTLPLPETSAYTNVVFHRASKKSRTSTTCYRGALSSQIFVLTCQTLSLLTLKGLTLRGFFSEGA